MYSSSSSKRSRQERQSLEVFNQVLSRLHDLDRQETKLPGFEDEIWQHFLRLPARYAMDVNVERADNVLMHKRLLQLADDPSNIPTFEVRLVQVHPTSADKEADSDEIASSNKEEAHSFSSRETHPPPTFGSSSNLEGLGHQINETKEYDGEKNFMSIFRTSGPMHEITFSTIDNPELLRQLTSLLLEIGLNIEEAHAFSTTDGFSLVVFVVVGWPYEETELLKSTLEREISKIKQPLTEQCPPDIAEQSNKESHALSEYVKIPADEIDVWEIDAHQLKFERKIASGSFGDLNLCSIMVMDDTESCGSRAMYSSASPKRSRQEWQRLEVFNEVLSRLHDLDRQETKLPGFEDEIWQHFNRLPARYTMDVNVERAEDVLMHKILLQLAEDPCNRPTFEVRLVQVHSTSADNEADSDGIASSNKEEAHSFSSRGTHPPPTFGSSSNLEGLGHQSKETEEDDGEKDFRPMHEITFSTIDNPKLLSQLTSLLSEIGLNIEEAHAFSTTDDFSLVVFVVVGWPYEETELLKSTLEREISKIKVSLMDPNYFVSVDEPDDRDILGRELEMSDIEDHLAVIKEPGSGGSTINFESSV